jgi:hypothetical protein
LAEQKGALAAAHANYEERLRESHQAQQEAADEAKSTHAEILKDVRSNYHEELERLRRQGVEHESHKAGERTSEFAKLMETHNVRLREKEEEARSLRTLLDKESARHESTIREVEQLRANARLAEGATETAAQAKQKVETQLQEALAQCNRQQAQLLEMVSLRAKHEALVAQSDEYKAALREAQAALQVSTGERGHLQRDTVRRRFHCVAFLNLFLKFPRFSRVLTVPAIVTCLSPPLSLSLSLSLLVLVLLSCLLVLFSTSLKIMLPQ